MMLLSVPAWPTLRASAPALPRPASRAATSALRRASTLLVRAKKDSQPSSSDSKRDKPSKKKGGSASEPPDSSPSPAAAAAPKSPKDKKAKPPKKSAADALSLPADNTEHLLALLAELACLRAALAASLAPTTPAFSSTTQFLIPSPSSPPKPLAIPANPPIPFPVLSEGEDDIRWMAFLHAQLYAAGYAVDDEETDGWLFGPSTREAVFTLQACARPPLPETGVMDGPTWAVLMAHEADPSLRPDPAWLLRQIGMGEKREAVPAAAPEGRFADFNRPATSTFSGGDLFSNVVDDGGHGEDDNEGEHVPQFLSDDHPNSAGWDSTGAASLHRWPPLRRDDGGRAVAALQALLEAAGYYCEEDEGIYWTFGLSTEAALRTFQACEGLNETGVADGATWRALAGEEGWAAGPADTFDRVVDDDKDMGQDGVWLLGEQRWERPGRVSPPA